MNTKKALIFILMNTLMMGGFPDFRVGKQDKYLYPDLPLVQSIPTKTYDLSQVKRVDDFITLEELIATPTPKPTPTPTPIPTPTATPTPTPTPTPKPTPTSVPLGKTQSEHPGDLTFTYPETAPLNTDTSTYTLIVNKEYPLSSKYIPYMVEPNVEIYHKGINERRYLQPIAATALEEMFSAADADGFHLVLRCGFRSYRLQKSVYSWNLETYGYYEVSRYHALPGTSEHQTGLAVDLCCEATDYKNNYDILKTPEYAWLLDNAHLYGWILRYPEDKTDITGYNFEPWHFRYVGIELATYLKEQDLVLEEYYGVLPTSNLLLVPEEYWKYLSEEDFALMQKDIDDYEKKQAELAQQPTPTPDITPDIESTVTPTPDITPETEPTVAPTPDITPDIESTVTPTPDITPETEPTVTPTPTTDPIEPFAPEVTPDADALGSPTPEITPTLEPFDTPTPLIIPETT